MVKNIFDKSLRKAEAYSIIKGRSSLMPKAELRRDTKRIPMKKMKAKGGRVVLVRSPWRKGMVDAEFDPRGRYNVLNVALTQRAIDDMVKGEDYTDDLFEALTIMFDYTYNGFKEKIEKYIPKDTGNLRRSLLGVLRAFRKNIKDNGRCDMMLGTNLPYAVYVNEMPTYPAGADPVTKQEKEAAARIKFPSGSGPHVRHPPIVGRHNRTRKGGKLNDPAALGNFMKWIVLRTRQKVTKEAIRRGYAYLTSKWGQQTGWTRWTQWRKFFKHKNRGYD